LNIIFLNFLKEKKIFDIPGEFKSHKLNTPKGSGLGITLFLIVCLINFYLNNNYEIYNIGIPRFYSLIAGLCILFLVSFYDDYLGINPFIRLLIQITICFLCLSSLPFNLWGSMNQYVTFSKLNWLMIIYFWLFIINLTNFFDGVDFIITIKLFFVSLIYLIIGLLENNFILCNLSFILLIASLILSFFNFYPAKFFLGDSGSIPLGFLLGWVFIYMSQEGLLIECIIINLPHFLDIIFVEIKKLSRLENIFIRHRDFIFQKKYDLEVNKNRFYLKYIFIYFLLSILSILSYLSEFNTKTILLIISIMFSIVFLYVNKK
tara:strand:+ start:104 stop:1060 length:957 start_codon:yes stop_codon:yes gene_type:complete